MQHSGQNLELLRWFADCLLLLDLLLQYLLIMLFIFLFTCTPLVSPGKWDPQLQIPCFRSCFPMSYPACVCAGGCSNCRYCTAPYYISSCLFSPFPRLSASFLHSNASLQYSRCLSQLGVTCEYHLCPIICFVPESIRWNQTCTTLNQTQYLQIAQSSRLPRPTEYRFWTNFALLLYQFLLDGIFLAWRNSVKDFNKAQWNHSFCFPCTRSLFAEGN